MLRSSLTGYVDIAQIAIYLFWGFFAGLIYYLRREDHREGFPAVSSIPGKTDLVVEASSFMIPPPKTFRLFHGGTVQAPPGRPPRMPEGCVPAAGFPGAPLQPTGNPLLDGIGPASWAYRMDEPDLTIDGLNKFKPLRITMEYRMDPHSVQPQGMRVVASDGIEVGTVVDVWIDEIAHEVVFLEIELDGISSSLRTPLSSEPEMLPRVLLPAPMLRYRARRRQVSVRALLAEQFLDIPRTRHPDMITRLEEERILAYYGGGYLYGTPNRLGPLL